MPAHAHRFLLLLLPLVLAVALVPRAARAQADEDKATARQLGQQGESALDAGNWSAAEDDFRRADALFHAPSLVLGLARSQSHEGKVIEAWESYHRIILENVTTSPVFVKALHDASAEIVAVEARRARLTIRVVGPDAPRVATDGVALKTEALGIERLVNPGHHTVTVEADGWKSAKRQVDLRDGGAEIVSITLERGVGVEAPLPAPIALPAPTSAAEPASPGHSLQRTLGIVALAVGGAGLLTGAIAGGVAIGDHSSLSGPCKNGSCPPDQQGALSSYHTVGAVSTAGFIIGGLGVAGGLVLFLTAPKDAGRAASTGFIPFVGPGSAGVVGRF